MGDFLGHLVDAPLANILILAGLGFLAVAVIGKFAGKIEPGTSGRLMSGVLGILLLAYGIYSHSAADKPQSQSGQGAEKQDVVATQPQPATSATRTQPEQPRVERTVPATQPQPAAPKTPIPQFAGTWEVVEGTRNDIPLTYMNGRRITFAQNGNRVRVNNHELTITSAGAVTYKSFHAHEEKSWHEVQTEDQADLVDTFTWRLEGTYLVGETTFHYKVPIDGRAPWTDVRVLKYRRVATE